MSGLVHRATHSRPPNYIVGAPIGYRLQQAFLLCTTMVREQGLFFAYQNQFFIFFDVKKTVL
uniref:AlNc14C698G12414 protein n=1 Tax=Albugo laibachii Nc14 TaxID=890382 RepID=F0X1V1_9STRA|nr:AlNc14C698G12414 [Albugo laibachii Nc14]|eukprot:CCA27807.1 AlNc14C698G12414 [Albugo laibachii Nc14]